MPKQLKYFCLVLAVTLAAACKKDKASPIPHSDHKLKMVKTGPGASYNNAANSTLYFFYNNNQLAHTLRIDSAYTNPDWLVFNYTEEYLYDAAGKLILLDNPPYVHRFIYDANNRLMQRIRNGPAGSDTIRFTYTNKGVIGTWQYSKTAALYYYFSRDLDRIEDWGLQSISPARSFYYDHEGRADLAGLPFIKSIDILIKADFDIAKFNKPHWYNVFENTGITSIWPSALPPGPGIPTNTFSVQHFAHTYNGQNYPAEVLRDGKPVISYFYY